MPTYKKAPKEVNEMAAELLCGFEGHKPLLDNRVTVDYMLAYGDTDEDGHVIKPAIQKAGVTARGQCRIMGPKDRAMGRSDSEIMLDADWWDDASPEQQKALLEHELWHLSIKTKKFGGPCERDDSGRPLLKLRHHDYDFGWFSVIAARHGAASQERIQAAQLMSDGGQYFWPDLFDGKARAA
jgi:hypothetical protein